MRSVVTYRSRYYMYLLNGQIILSVSAGLSLLISLFKLIDGITGMLDKDKLIFKKDYM